MSESMTVSDVRHPVVARRENGGWLLAMGLLSLPFLIMILALHGLKDIYQTFHYTDEPEYHYPIILDFMRTFPRANLADYNSATTPLFHLMAAWFGVIINSSLPALRLINVVATWLFAGVVFLMANRVLRTDYWTSVLLALTISLAPYIFGTSFILLTDNLALLFAISTLYFAFRYMDSQNKDHLILAALFAAAAVLTRQLYLWLMPTIFVVWVLSLRRNSSRNPTGILALLLLSAVPYGLLVVLWGGLNPPRFSAMHQWNLRAFGILAACIGTYGAPFVIATISQWRQRFGYGPFFLMIAAATAVTLLVAPLHNIPYDPNCAGQLLPMCFPTDGYMWKISSKLPNVAGSSLLFWILVPFGYATLLCAWSSGRSATLQADRFYLIPVVIFVTYAAISTANTSPYQKYYDFAALIICMLIFFRPGHYRPMVSRLVLAGYCCLFVAFAAARFA